MNEHRNFHAVNATAGSTNEVIPLGIVQHNEVLSAGPIP